MEPPIMPSTENVPTTMTTRLRPIIIPLLKPMTSIRITTTISTDSLRLIKKVVSASVTRSGW